MWKAGKMSGTAMLSKMVLKKLAMTAATWAALSLPAAAQNLFATADTVDDANITEYEILGDPPPELESFREANGFDFGKFDYVEVEGRSILLDINKTPAIAASHSTPDTPRMRHLAEGLYDFTGAL
jgi:hypothetical protein